MRGPACRSPSSSCAIAPSAITSVQPVRPLRFVLVVGHLQARLIYSRYPWHDKVQLRDQVIETVLSATADCLLGRSVPAHDSA